MKNNKGFTLLEVIITIGIIGLLMGFFTTFFSNEIKLYYSKDNDIELKQDARIAIDRIVSKIRSKNGLTFTPGPDGTGVIYKGSSILINTTKNDIEGEINFSFDDTKGYGEIRDSSGNRIANYIKDFKLEKQDIPDTEGLVKIIICCGNNKTSEIKEYSTVVRMYCLSDL